MVRWPPLPGCKVADKRCLWCWLITNYGGDGNWCCYHSATIPFDKNAKSTWTIESLKGLSAFSIVSESLKANTMKRFTNSLRHVYRNPQDTPGHVLCLWLFSPGKGKYFTWDWIFSTARCSSSRYSLRGIHSPIKSSPHFAYSGATSSFDGIFRIGIGG